jgi:hypothetical protein
MIASEKLCRYCAKRTECDEHYVVESLKKDSKGMGGLSEIRLLRLAREAAVAKQEQQSCFERDATLEIVR